MNKKEIKKAIEFMSRYIDDECYTDNCMKYHRMAVSALTQQLTNGWIPCKEQQPEKSDIYLATFIEGGKRYVERFYYSDIIGWMMPVAWQDEGRIDEIIAWQPLPEPYKEVSDAERN